MRRSSQLYFSMLLPIAVIAFLAVAVFGTSKARAAGDDIMIQGQVTDENGAQLANSTVTVIFDDYQKVVSTGIKDPACAGSAVSGEGSFCLTAQKQDADKTITFMAQNKSYQKKVLYHRTGGDDPGVARVNNDFHVNFSLKKCPSGDSNCGVSSSPGAGGTDYILTWYQFRNKVQEVLKAGGVNDLRLPKVMQLLESNDYFRIKDKRERQDKLMRTRVTFGEELQVDGLIYLAPELRILDDWEARNNAIVLDGDKGFSWNRVFTNLSQYSILTKNMPDLLKGDFDLVKRVVDENSINAFADGPIIKNKKDISREDLNKIYGWDGVSIWKSQNYSQPEWTDEEFSAISDHIKKSFEDQAVFWRLYGSNSILANGPKNAEEAALLAQFLVEVGSVLPGQGAIVEGALKPVTIGVGRAVALIKPVIRQGYIQLKLNLEIIALLKQQGLTSNFFRWSGIPIHGQKAALEAIVGGRNLAIRIAGKQEIFFMDSSHFKIMHEGIALREDFCQVPNVSVEDIIVGKRLSGGGIAAGQYINSTKHYSGNQKLEDLSLKTWGSKISPGNKHPDEYVVVVGYNPRYSIDQLRNFEDFTSHEFLHHLTKFSDYTKFGRIEEGAISYLMEIEGHSGGYIHEAKVVSELVDFLYNFARRPGDPIAKKDFARRVFFDEGVEAFINARLPKIDIVGGYSWNKWLEMINSDMRWKNFDAAEKVIVWGKKRILDISWAEALKMNEPPKIVKLLAEQWQWDAKKSAVFTVRRVVSAEVIGENKQLCFLCE